MIKLLRWDTHVLRTRATARCRSRIRPLRPLLPRRTDCPCGRSRSASQRPLRRRWTSWTLQKWFPRSSIASKAVRISIHVPAPTQVPAHFIALSSALAPRSSRGRMSSSAKALHQQTLLCCQQSGIFRQNSSIESSKKRSKSESLCAKGPEGGTTAVPGHMTCRLRPEIRVPNSDMQEAVET